MPHLTGYMQNVVYLSTYTPNDINLHFEKAICLISDLIKKGISLVTAMEVRDFLIDGHDSMGN